MAHAKAKVITFDLWDTVFADDTDEPKRAAAGRPSKRDERRQLVHAYLNRHEPIAREAVNLAYDVVDAAFRKVWHDQHFTWRVAERLEVLLQGLGRKLPDAEFQELVRLHEEMELEFRPNFAPGIHEALRQLHGKYTLAVVSDAIFSPGRCLRELLKGEGLLDCFDVFVFSDEVGASKPAPQVFHAIAKETGCRLDEIVHIGDREHNDIGGPHAVGARGVLTTVVKDRGSNKTEADAVCNDYSKLCAIIESLDKA
jgi:putative hydrolase of the HAD superfamily